MKHLNGTSSLEMGGDSCLAMPTCKACQWLGFCDVELRVPWWLTKGNPLSCLDAVVAWELLRPLWDAALAKPAQGPGGRPPQDRLSFQQFIGWTLADKAPDANTIWDFREALIQAHIQSKLIEQYAGSEASVHNSQKLETLVASTDGAVYAESAYRSAQAEALLAEKAVASQMHERAYRNRPLTEAQKENNRQKSRIRVRIEPLFGYMSPLLSR